MEISQDLPDPQNYSRLIFLSFPILTTVKPFQEAGSPQAMWYHPNLGPEAENFEWVCNMIIS